ncbi:hypothetical protein [Desulforudis sp. DRI-14]|uniref:hypothetical protein n=1 Tax=Desulforudis sp. DRI-14 TaxID=3459793 RepID=UPI004042AE55
MIIFIERPGRNKAGHEAQLKKQPSLELASVQLKLIFLFELRLSVRFSEERHSSSQPAFIPFAPA